MVMYVLLTGRQPFSTPKTEDPMVVMRRIVDENYIVKYPPYVSSAAKVRSEGRGNQRGRGRGRGQQVCKGILIKMLQVLPNTRCRCC